MLPTNSGSRHTASPIVATKSSGSSSRTSSDFQVLSSPNARPRGSNFGSVGALRAHTAWLGIWPSQLSPAVAAEAPGSSGSGSGSGVLGPGAGAGPRPPRAPPFARYVSLAALGACVALVAVSVLHPPDWAHVVGTGLMMDGVGLDEVRQHRLAAHMEAAEGGGGGDGGDGAQAGGRRRGLAPEHGGEGRA